MMVCCCSPLLVQSTHGQFAADRVQPPTTDPPPIVEVLESTPDTRKAKPTFRLRGRIQADALFATQGEQNKQAFGNILNTTGFRRARLGAEGEFGQQGHWVAEWDFAGGDIRFRDVSTVKIDQIQLENGGQGSSQQNDKWYDNLVIATSYIGPMATGTPPPRPQPPTNVRIVR